MTIVCCNNTNPARRRVYYTNRSGEPIEPTRTHICTLPEPQGVTGLAQFLAEHVTNTSNHRGVLTVVCYDDTRTEGDLVRASGQRNADAVIRAYDLDAHPARVEDWLFPVIGDGESAESYWSRAADGMRAAGVNRVVVRHPLNGVAEYRV